MDGTSCFTEEFIRYQMADMTEDVLVNSIVDSELISIRCEENYEIFETMIQKKEGLNASGKNLTSDCQSRRLWFDSLLSAPPSVVTKKIYFL